MISLWWPAHISQGSNILDTPGLSPPIIIINRHRDTGLWLVERDHVTLWLVNKIKVVYIENVCLWQSSMLMKLPVMHFAYFGIYESYLCRSSLSTCCCMFLHKTPLSSNQMTKICYNTLKIMNTTTLYFMIGCCGFWQVNITISISIYSSLPEA